MDEEGILRDAFELGDLFLLSKVTEGVQKKSHAHEVWKSFEEELKNVGKIVDRSLTSDFYVKATEIYYF